MTIHIAFEGNLTADPELRFTPGGDAVANFTVAHTPRTFNKKTSEWDDGETLFFRCSVWRQLAENVAESLSKGCAVVVTGKLAARSWEDKQGTKRTDLEVNVDNIGPALARATAVVHRTTREQAKSGNVVAHQQNDPWATNTEPAF